MSRDCRESEGVPQPQILPVPLRKGVSLDTGQPPSGGVRAARAGTELIFAFAESHVRGGARVEIPLKDSNVRLQRPPRQVLSRLA